MGELVYTAITSLDGYVADASGGFDWAAPSEEVHRFVTELERPVGTYLYGRRLYEVMRFWDRDSPDIEESSVMREYAQVWRAADKVVFSLTLTAVDTARTRLVRSFDAAEVRREKDSSPREMSIGGPGLAAAALRAGLLDELRWIAVPVVVGGGTRWLPDGLELGLDLIDERRFADGAVHLRYRVRP
jgi:dihydrofolate reductase